MRAAKALKAVQITMLACMVLVMGIYFILFPADCIFGGAVVRALTDIGLWNNLCSPVLMYGVLVLPVIYFIMLLITALVKNRNKKLTTAAIWIPLILYAVMLINEYWGFEFLS